MNVGVHVSFQMSVFIPLDTHPGVELLCADLTLSLLRILGGIYITPRAFYLAHVTLPITSRTFYSHWWDRNHLLLQHISRGRMLNFLCININSCLGLIPQPRTLCTPVLHLLCLASGSSLVYLEPRSAGFYILKVHFKRAFSILIWGSQAL